MKRKITIMVLSLFTVVAMGQNPKFNGLSTGLQDLYKLSDAKTRSISPENRTGEKGKGGMQTLDKGTAKNAARELGQGWKVNPYLRIGPDSTTVLAEITGPGAIQQMWFTPTGNWRFSILRIYWDDETSPSVEVPIGDFFVQGWCEYHPIVSIPICVNPGSAFNSYWIMPFRKKCKITLTNIDTKRMTVYYQINYTLTDVADDAAYFHAQYRRVDPLPEKTDYTIVDNIKGKGHYVGTIMNWGAHNNDWWGEGEIKFFMDGDKQFPTICGTGTEDYFCGSYCFITNSDPNNKTLATGRYTDYTTPYAGFYSVKNNYNVDVIQPRYGLYRWHITDPVRFDKDLRVTMQALGWKSGGRYLPLKDDISSVSIWYQTEPHNPFPKLPSKDNLEVD